MYWTVRDLYVLRMLQEMIYVECMEKKYAQKQTVFKLNVQQHQFIVLIMLVCVFNVKNQNLLHALMQVVDV
jgi:hypothetical protein